MLPVSSGAALRRCALAGAAALAICGAAAPHASGFGFTKLQEAFDLHNSFDSSWLTEDAFSGLDTVATPVPTFTSVDTDGGGPNPTRPVAAFADGTGFAVPTDFVPSRFTYAVDFYAELADVSGTNRLVSFSAANGTKGLYIKDGHVFFDDGGSTATGTATIANGAFHRFTIVRTGSNPGPDGTLKVYVDGASDISTTEHDGSTILNPSTFYLFVDSAATPGTNTSAGQLARLRLFNDQLSDSEVAGLHALDLQSPLDAVLDAPALTGGVRRFGPNSRIAGTMDDLGGSRLDPMWRLYSGPNVVISSAMNETHPTNTPVDGTFTERVTTAFGTYPPDGLSIVNGASYTLKILATDASGNPETVTSFPVIGDTAGPTGFGITGPSGTISDRHPVPTGTASQDADADSFIEVALYKGTDTSANDAFLGESFLHASGPTWTGPAFKKFDNTSHTFVAIGDLADGVYTLSGDQCDTSNNCTSVTRQFTVGTPPATTGGTTGGGGTQGGGSTNTPPGGGTVVTGPVVKSPAQVLTEAAAKAADALDDLSLTKLAGGGGASLPAQVPAAGTEQYDLLKGGGSVRAVAAKKRKKAKTPANVLGTGKKVFPAAGSGTVTVRLSPAGRKWLKHKKKAVVTLRSTFTPKAGGKKVVVTRKVTLKK